MINGAEGIQIVMVAGGGVPQSALLNVTNDNDTHLCILCWIAGGWYYELRLKEQEALKLAEILSNSNTKSPGHQINETKETMDIAESGDMGGMQQRQPEKRRGDSKHGANSMLHDVDLTKTNQAR